MTWVCCLVSMVTGAHVTVVGCCLREPVNDAMRAHYCKHGLIAVIITSSIKSNFKSDRFYPNSQLMVHSVIHFARGYV